MLQIRQCVFNLTKNNFSGRALSAERYIRCSEFVTVFKVSLFGTMYVYAIMQTKNGCQCLKKNTIT